MKYLRAEFKNYIGFYNGMGLDKIEIDFTKCQHNIVLIMGANGVGKSTLMEHLNPFPDSSSSFIPNKTAEKRLILFNNGDVYNINIISPADLKGRKTTKAYIQKNGVELNDNGNVTSYKDIIFSEFELDSNYISLSRLSSNDRGLGDKTPSERKKFASNIIDNLETYNTMYKALNKKSLIYKSHINTLHTKIQNIGSKDNLEMRLNNLRARESDLNNKIMNANNQIVTIQAKTSIDENEAREMQLVSDVFSELSSKLDLLRIKIDSLHHKTKINPEDISSKYESDKNLLQVYSSKVSELSNIWKDKNSRLSDISSNIDSINAQLSSTSSEDNISERYIENKSKLVSLEKELSEIEIPSDTNLIFSLTNLLSFCEKFIQYIEHFYDNMNPKDIKFVVLDYTSTLVSNLQLEQSNLLAQLSSKKDELSDISSKISILSVLDNRPDKCKIDSCPFISEALTLKKSIKVDPVEIFERLNTEIKNISDKITELQSEIDYANSMAPKYTEFGIIRNLIAENSSILQLIYPEFYNNYISMVLNTSPFNIIRDHKKVSDGLNLLKIYESELQSNKVLEVEYESFKERIKLINSSKNMLTKLESEMNTLLQDVEKYKSEIDNYNSLISSLNSSIQTETEYVTIYSEYKSVEEEYNNCKAKIDEFNKKSSKAMESISIINSLRNDIEKLSVELNPVMNEISSISGQLTLLDSYYAEYNEYRQSYDIIETLKKYCSPTGGGIQTLFMQIYMSKTKDLTNEVLGMLFNGNYQLLDFVINDNEFRIPFIGEGLPVDDISSGSSSQISMMSMIINLVLLHQGSTKFNIAQLDEIDGALDSYNRSEFINILFYSMKILEIEQLFIISHSVEADNSFADIIKLKSYDNYESGVQSGNIIFDYNEYIK